ncbi:unnamed protein product, partial [Strongylus vulgaris]
MLSGKNIYLLKWDCDLERMAQEWAQSCPLPYARSRRVPRGSQLIKRINFNLHGKNVTQHIDNSMRSWWLEYRTRGNLDVENRYFNRQDYYGWANMAKGKTTRLGCSYMVCGDKAIFTCVYNNKVNIEKRKIYESGRPCSSDRDCTTYPSSRCIPELGLCQAPDVPKDRTSNNMCGGVASSMTDYSRQFSLDVHNFY